MDRPMDVLQSFPVRKNRAQKSAFLQEAQEYCNQLGYDVRIEKGSFGVRNLIIGNPESARFLVTAHYDTCARLPFPNLITPCSLVLFLAWQLLLVIILCLPVGIVAGFIGALTNEPSLGVLFAYFLLFVELVFMLVGPANPHNANDNTSGVVAVLETAATIPHELRDRVCFVLFDLEEAGLLGSSAYRKLHRKDSSRQLVLNLDCVGEGDEILLFPTGKLKKNDAYLNRISALCRTSGNKTITLRQKGFAVYPSDQANFPLGIGIAAMRRSKWAGLYLAKIHTPKDKILDENNVALIRDYLIDLIRDLA